MTLQRYEHCPNCGDPSPRDYCAACGQRNFDLHVSFRKIVGEFFGELASVDSRIARTIVPFLFRPGELTRAYLAGQRKRFSSPIRLFLVASFLAFVVAPLRSSTSAENQRQMTPEQRTELAQTAEKLRHRGLFGRMMAKQVERLSTEDPRAFNARLQQSFFSAMTKVAFALLPAFALLLKLFYLRSRRFYAEHLVFSIHLHSFAFFVTAIGALIGIGMVQLVLTLAIVVYTVSALRRVYGQGWGLTIAKSIGLGLSYLVLLVGGVTVAAIVAFMTA
jgi:hypothetical protein